MNASDLIERANGDDVDAGWWNQFRTFLQGIFGTGSHGETEIAIANSQTNANVTGLSFSSSVCRRAVVELDIQRNPGASEKIAECVLKLQLRNGSWEVLGQQFEGDSDHGMEFSVTAAGQVQYTSDAAGTGSLKFKSRTFDA